MTKNVVGLAVEEINNSGGIDKRQVDVVYEDGKCNGKDATSAVQKLINIDKVKVVIGGMCSGELLAMAPILNENKILALSPLASSPEITKAGDYIFRNSPSDALSGKFSAELVVKRGHRKIAILSEKTDYAQAFKETFLANLKKLGVLGVNESDVLSDDYLQSSKDQRSQLLKIKNFNPDALFANGQTGITAGATVKQARELGIKAQIYIFYLGGDKDFQATSGEFKEGIITVDMPELNENQSKAKEFLDKYLARYGEKPSLPMYAALTYDAVYILKDSIKSVGYNSDKIKNYLYNLKNYQGTGATYSFDENGDIIGIDFTAKRIAKDGSLVPLEQ
jgi:branched-chain amino acid transport system substrate-binding protein